tara:strand:- start:225 stop:575 length:351 start_codon:yes stop_codon:yes gene_type:complete
MKKNIKVDKKEGTVTVEISVPKRNYVREPIISFRTKDIALLLEKEGIEIESCIQSDTIYNDGRVPKTEGNWVFKVKQKHQKQTKPNVEELKVNQNLTKDNKSDKIVSRTKTPKKRK